MRNKELKEYSFHLMERGIQLKVMICANSVKSVASVFDVSEYFIRTYASVTPAKTELGIKNPLLRMAMFEKIGEQVYFVPKELLGVAIKYIDAVSIINEHRKICRTYAETEKKYKW